MSVFLPLSGLLQVLQPFWNSLQDTQVVRPNANPRMKISDLLWSPEPIEKDSSDTVTVTPQPAKGCSFSPSKPIAIVYETGKTNQLQSAKAAKFAVVPDKKRKRHYHMSATQKRLRRDHAAFESRVFNLTLDINNLRQEVMQLLEYRDLQITRLLLNRQRLANSLLNTVEAMIRGVRNNIQTPACRFSRAITNQGKSEPAMSACDNVYEFAIRLDKSRFSCVISGMQVLFDEDAESEETSEARRVCGVGGCVVKVASEFTFLFRRRIFTAVFPHATADEMLMARLIGLRITCPVRLLLSFNAQRELVRQIAQADILPALLQARPRETAAFLDRAHPANNSG